MGERRTGYSILHYGHMVACEPRMSAYATALRSAVTPGCTVIDIGAGPGIFAILACKYGAGSVIAIDPSESVELISELAEANGCADRITIVRGLSSDFTPERRADVIISDIRGILPLFEGHIAAIADARARLLAPGGRLIPSQDVLRVALVSDPDTYRPFEEPWIRNRYDLDLSAAQRFPVNSFVKVNLEAGALISDPQDLAILDYMTISDPNMESSFELETARAGVVHGLLIWFDAELSAGVGFSNAPGQPRQIYGQTFFPLTMPLKVIAGDRVEGGVGARIIGGEYVWTWTSRLLRNGEPLTGEIRQSTFLSKVMATDTLRSRRGDHVPEPHPLHEVDRYCLSLFDGENSLQDVAQLLAAQFRDTFASDEDALDHVAKLANAYE